MLNIYICWSIKYIILVYRENEIFIISGFNTNDCVLKEKQRWAYILLRTICKNAINLVPVWWLSKWNHSLYCQHPNKAQVLVQAILLPTQFRAEVLENNNVLESSEIWLFPWAIGSALVVAAFWGLRQQMEDSVSPSLKFCLSNKNNESLKNINLNGKCKTVNLKSAR